MEEQIIDSELLQLENTGLTAQAVGIGGKEYVLHLPSLEGMKKVAECLAELVPSETANLTFDEAIRVMADSKAMARCVSFIIQGDETLADALSANGTVDELQDAIITYYAMTSRSMKTLAALASSIGKLIGKQKIRT